MKVHTFDSKLTGSDRILIVSRSSRTVRLFGLATVQKQFLRTSTMLWDLPIV